MNIYTIISGTYYENSQLEINCTCRKDVDKFILQYENNFDYLQIYAFNTRRKKIYFDHFLDSQEIDLIKLKNENQNSCYDYEIKKDELEKYCNDHNLRIDYSSNENKKIIVSNSVKGIGIVIHLDYFKKFDYSVIDYIKYYNEQKGF